MTAERKDQVASAELTATLMNNHVFTVRMNKEHVEQDNVAPFIWGQVLQSLKESRDKSMKVYLHRATDWQKAKVTLAEANRAVRVILSSTYSVKEHAVILSKLFAPGENQWP